jgi:hypothetical protein
MSHIPVCVSPRSQVCCTGRIVRCAVADLYKAALGQTDVVIRPTGGGPCTRRALSYARPRAGNSSGLARPEDQATAGARRAGLPDPTGGGTLRTNETAGSAVPSPSAGDGLSGSVRYVSGDVVERTAHEMVAASFCLCPAGDTCVTSRLYTAIAAGCIPVVLCDGLVGAFAEHARYSSFWVKFPSKAFLRSPASLLPILRELSSNATEMKRRRRALSAARREVLYDEPWSRVGTRYLEAAVTRCSLPRAKLSDESAVNKSMAGHDPRCPTARHPRAHENRLMRGVAFNYMKEVNDSNARDTVCLRKGGASG